MVIPRFEKQAFDPERIENISDGLTPTTIFWMVKISRKMKLSKPNLK